MAEFGTNVTRMSDPSLGGAGFIASGVEDRSGALRTAATTGLIGDVGTLGKELYKGKQLADIESSQEQVIQDYMDRKNPDQLKVEAAALKEADINLFQQPGVTPEDVAPVQKKFNETLTRYKSAVDQGVMSPEEFSTRTLTVLRDAVNKNPGMLQELSDHANKVLELSGITGIIKQDQSAREAMAKAEKETIAYELSIAKEFKVTVPYNPDGSINRSELRQKNAQVQGEAALLDAAGRQRTFSEEQFRSFGPNYSVSLVNNATSRAVDLLSDPTIPYDKAITSVNMMFDSVERDFLADPRVGQIIDKPAVQNSLSIIKSQIAAAKENLKKFASKEEAAAYLKNTTDMLRNQQYLAVSQTVNPVALDTLSKSMAVPGIANLINKYPEKMVMISDSIGKLAQGINTDAVTLYQQFTPGEKPVGIQVLTDQLNTAGTVGNEKSVGALANIIKTFKLDMQNMSSPQDKFIFQEKYIKSLGTPTAKVGLGKLDDIAATDATQAVDEYTQTTLSGFLDQVRDYFSQGIKVTLDKLPDGRISIKSDSPKVTDELTRKYTIRLNDSLAAFANLTGSSMSEASPRFFSGYGKYFGVQQTQPAPTEASFTRVSPQVVTGTIKRD